MPDHGVKSLMLLVYFFLDLAGLTNLLFSNLPERPMGDVPLPVLIWMPFNRCEAPPDRMVLARLIAVCLALACRFCDILAPLLGFSLALQVLALATTRPFLVPEVHRKPCFTPLPATRLNTRLTPSIMAERFDGAVSCATTSSVLVSLMALGCFGCRISDIFMTVFIVIPDGN